MANIYERIRTRRKELKITQDELAKIMGYTSRSSIAKIEAGAHDIPRSKILQFATALKTSPTYLMGWDETQIEKPVGNDEFFKKQRAMVDWVLELDDADLDKLKKMIELVSDE